MLVASLFSAMAANMLAFGVLSHTVENFSRGETETNFMPPYEDLELWETVVHPFFLSIGAYIASFAPFILTMLIGLYFVSSSVSTQNETIRNRLENIPGTEYYSARNTVQQSESVKKTLDQIDEEQNARVYLRNEIATGKMNGDPGKQVANTVRQDEFDKSRRDRPDIIAAEQERPHREFAGLQAFLGLSPVLVVIGATLFFWGLFLFPATCVVAGYTRSFSATINPIVALDTIRRLGGTYAKIVLMGLALLSVSITVSGVVHVVFAPFSLPAFGNLPARGFAAMFAFYCISVFSCVLGYALYKRSDKLQLRS
ncbi:MAG: hypothetical protein LC734_08380 [Acidobacteria bacterium]|nr:hypothetical protein [Acidobacteriota bacterium]